MKNLLFITIAIIYIANTTSTAQEKKFRNVMWIHGLGGSEASWKTNSEFHGHPTNGRYEMRSITPAYGTGNLSAVTSAAKAKIKQELGKEGATENKNIAVCHSFGGLVGRSIELQNDKDKSKQNFGGFITVHTPNLGTNLAENVIKGSFKRSATKIIDNIIKPITNDPLVSKTEIKLADAFLKNFDINDMSDFSEMIKLILTGESGKIFDNFQDLAELYGWFDPSKIGDLVPGNPRLNELNDFNGPGERITIWGAESTNIFARLMSSMMVHPGTKPLDIVSDNNMDKTFSDIRDLYNINGMINRTFGTLSDLSIVGGLFKIFGAKQTPFHERARQWFEGADYMAHQLENDYLLAIGAIEFETRTNTVRDMTPICLNKLNNLEELLANFHKTGEYKSKVDVLAAMEEIQNDPNCYENKTVSTTVPVLLPCDGVVTVKTQKGENANNDGTFFENKDCNHFEALNTKVMSDNFTKIFRDGGAGDFFKTAIR